MREGTSQFEGFRAPMVHVWFGDHAERELQPSEMFLAVYAAGGGKRNMANFVRSPSRPGSEEPALFRTSDVHIYLSSDGTEISRENSRLFICRWASGRGEWVPKTIPTWDGQSQLKLVPEWFKARFWDNKQEKKHPWFMFGLLTERDGVSSLFTSASFPVHQYYPTGAKKTDPNETACRAAFHKVLKLAPPTLLRPEQLLKKAGMCSVRSPSPVSTAMSSALSSPASASEQEFWHSDDASDEGGDRVDSRRYGKAALFAAAQGVGHAYGYIERGMDGRRQRAKLEISATTFNPGTEDCTEEVDAAQALLSLRLATPMR